jgi:uncharacterized protein (DUF427 family)
MSKPTPTQPGEGQESVWDYPRPPRLERVHKHVRIVFNGETIVDTMQAYRVLETSHPPVFYLPQADIKMAYLFRVPSAASLCEYKGQASYYTVKVGDRKAERVAWAYHNPTEAFRPILDHFAFYARPMDSCTVGGEEVIPQPGHFYGGWITSDVVGPFKGEPGSWGW